MKSIHAQTTPLSRFFVFVREEAFIHLLDFPPCEVFHRLRPTRLPG